MNKIQNSILKHDFLTGHKKKQNLYYNVLFWKKDKYLSYLAGWVI